MENLSIRKIIDKISSGEIRIPSFQRGFVWEPDSIAFLWIAYIKGIQLEQSCFGEQESNSLTKEV